LTHEKCVHEVRGGGKETKGNDGHRHTRRSGTKKKRGGVKSKTRKNPKVLKKKREAGQRDWGGERVRRDDSTWRTSFKLTGRGVFKKNRGENQMGKFGLVVESTSYIGWVT